VDGRLMADLGRIWQVPGRLSWVEREFSCASQFADGDGDWAFLGSDELASALHACVTGRGKQRDALIAQLSKVTRLSALAASSYGETDGQFGAVLGKAMGLP